MITYPKYFRIIKLNWLHLAGFYLVIELVMIAYATVEMIPTHNWQMFIAQIFLNALFLTFAYGFIPLIVFYAVLLSLDAILFASLKQSALQVVLIEWFIISPIFIYWAFKYGYWLWIALVVSFLVTQVWRSRRLAAYN